jgi:hypothetical protein
MLETIKETSFDAFAQTQQTYLTHMRALRKKFKKINNLARKNNDVMTMVYAEEAFSCLLSGNKNKFMSANRKLTKSLDKLQKLTEPYTIEEYEGERFMIEQVDEETYMFIDTRESVVVELSVDEDGQIIGFYTLDPDMVLRDA